MLKSIGPWFDSGRRDNFFSSCCYIALTHWNGIFFPLINKVPFFKVQKLSYVTFWRKCDWSCLFLNFQFHFFNYDSHMPSHAKPSNNLKMIEHERKKKTQTDTASAPQLPTTRARRCLFGPVRPEVVWRILQNFPVESSNQPSWLGHISNNNS